MDTAQIREEMEVVGSDNNHVGRVDHIQGEMIELAKIDLPVMGHHLIPLSWVDWVDDKVHLNCRSYEARQRWIDGGH